MFSYVMFQGEVIYSYSVITLDSNDTLSWLHHRMPAILEGEQIAVSIILYQLVIPLWNL
jgi:putative SOS response-associated peptidase YedK